MVWYGMVWYGMVCCCCCCCCGTRVPAGEIARHALPRQGAREQSAGVTLAGRVPTTTGGGGFRLLFWGGEGARVAVRGTTCPCDPGSLPRRGGRACAPVRNGGGTGGGMEGPPFQGPAGPRFLLLPPAATHAPGPGLDPPAGRAARPPAHGTHGWAPGNSPYIVPAPSTPLLLLRTGCSPLPCRGGVAAGRGGGGAMRVRGSWRSRGCVGGPAGGRRRP